MCCLPSGLNVDCWLLLLLVPRKPVLSLRLQLLLSVPSGLDGSCRKYLAVVVRVPRESIQRLRILH